MSRSMVPSLDQLLDLRTLLVVGAIVIIVAIAVAILLGRAPKRRSPAENPSLRRRLTIVESLDLDPHRRLVILRRDGVEHLVLIGGSSDIVIETRIERSVDRRLDDLAMTRSTRVAPDELPRGRLSPGFDEEPEPVTDFTESYIAVREPPPVATPPARAPLRSSPPSHPATEARTAFPRPPRHSAPPPESAASRAGPYRAPILSRTPPPPLAETPKEEAPSASRRSLATPFLRSTPPAAVVPDPGLDAQGDQEAPAGAEHVEPDVPTPEEPAAADAFLREETRPDPDATPTGADEATDVRPEPEVATEASADREPIDRLEAEIARLLGRAPADHVSR